MNHIQIKYESYMIMYSIFPWISADAWSKWSKVGEVGDMSHATCHGMSEWCARQFLFRSREFEQMEIEYFIDPEENCVWQSKWLWQRPDVENSKADRKLLHKTCHKTCKRIANSNLTPNTEFTLEILALRQARFGAIGDFRLLEKSEMHKSDLFRHLFRPS